MSRHRRTALAALVLTAVCAMPVSAALAQELASAPDPASAQDAATNAAPGVAPAADPFSMPVAPPEPPGRPPSGLVQRLAGWISATDDNGDKPFMIVDKTGARVFVFEEWGEFVGSAPVLLGLARGDDAAPGAGDLKLAQITDDQRTTPAGRFLAQFGASDGHGTMLWVDFADGIALHPVMSVNPGEHRLQRIKSDDPSQHRISYGCINVPEAFYDDVVMTTLAGGDAEVYVLPDTKPVEAVFPAFAAAAGLGKTEPLGQQAPNQEASVTEVLPDAIGPAPDAGASGVDATADGPKVTLSAGP